MSTRDAESGDGLSLLLVFLERAAWRGHGALAGCCLEEKDTYRIGVGANPWLPVRIRTHAAAIAKLLHRRFIMPMCVMCRLQHLFAMGYA